MTHRPPKKQRWHVCQIEKDILKALMKRSNRKGLLHAFVYFSGLFILGWLACLSIGTVWMVPTFFVYGTVYCFSNHMLHETHHRTPFRSDKLNSIFNWIAGFMIGEEPVFNRWQHLQHHFHTYSYPDDPEAEPERPVHLLKFMAKYFGFGPTGVKRVIKHACGRITEEADDYVPRSHWRQLVWSARGFIAAHILLIAVCLVAHSWLPLLFTVGARYYGAPIPRALDVLQHLGLETNVDDHRLNTRDVYLNPILQFLYWNMNYHIEHHMFPSVPFHALPQLHEEIKEQLPRRYNGLIEAHRELIPVLFKQQEQPSYHITPNLPEEPTTTAPEAHSLLGRS